MPCKCATRSMHYACLGEWLQHRRVTKAHDHCEVCRSPYFDASTCRATTRYRWMVGDLIHRFTPFVYLSAGGIVCIALRVFSSTTTYRYWLNQNAN
jgi:hypothetical protein